MFTIFLCCVSSLRYGQAGQTPFLGIKGRTTGNDIGVFCRQSRVSSWEWKHFSRFLFPVVQAPGRCHRRLTVERYRFWWRWRDSNPRPNKVPEGFLHAYSSFGFRPWPAERRASRSLSSESWRAVEASSPCIRFE